MGYGKALKDYLEYKELSVYWLSKVANIPRSTIHSIIQNDNFPKMDTARKISDALGVDIYELQGVPSVSSAIKQAQTKNEKDILELFNKLNVTGQNTALKMLEALASVPALCDTRKIKPSSKK